MRPTFHDRRDAGRALATKLLRYASVPDLLILALPRGGVPVAYEVARALHAPLDIFLVRKLGVPGHEELAMGAIALGDVRVLNDDVIRHHHIAPATVDRVASNELRELLRRDQAYRAHRPPQTIRNHAVILVDDGLATGATMRAAARAIRAQRPTRLVIAVPTAAAETCDDFRRDPAVDDVVCAITPAPFHAVGLSYEDFSQTTDDEVADLLAHAPHHRPTPHHAPAAPMTEPPPP